MSYLVGFFKDGKKIVSGRVYANNPKSAIKKAEFELFIRRPDLRNVRFEDVKII